jgi:hypothetical protein
MQVPLSLVCTAPFSEPPRLSLSYIIGGHNVVLSLKLPALPHKFMAPDASINKEFFFDQWKTWQVWAMCVCGSVVPQLVSQVG